MGDRNEQLGSSLLGNLGTVVGDNWKDLLPLGGKSGLLSTCKCIVGNLTWIPQNETFFPVLLVLFTLFTSDQCPNQTYSAKCHKSQIVTCWCSCWFGLNGIKID